MHFAWTISICMIVFCPAQFFPAFFFSLSFFLCVCVSMLSTARGPPSTSLCQLLFLKCDSSNLACAILDSSSESVCSVSPGHCHVWPSSESPMSKTHNTSHSLWCCGDTDLQNCLFEDWWLLSEWFTVWEHLAWLNKVGQTSEQR